MEFNFGIGSFTPKDNGFVIKLKLLEQDIRIQLTEPQKGWRDFTMIQININEYAHDKFQSNVQFRIPDIKPTIVENEGETFPIAHIDEGTEHTDEDYYEDEE
jgi:hypothetical protein